MSKKINMETSFKAAMEEAAMIDATIEEDEAFQAIEKRMDNIGQNGNDGLVYEKPGMINKPPHYQILPGVEVYDIRQALAIKCDDLDVPTDQFSDWDRALEYLLRLWEKNGIEDAKKCRWYLDKLIKKLENEK